MSRNIFVILRRKFRINRPAEFQIEIDWKRLYALSNASLPLELEKHVSARARMNLDQPEQRLTLLDDFFRGVQPDENGEYTSYVVYEPL